MQSEVFSSISTISFQQQPITSCLLSPAPSCFLSLVLVSGYHMQSLSLDYVIWHNAFKIHLCCYVYQDFILLKGWVIFQMKRADFLCLFTYQWTLVYLYFGAVENLFSFQMGCFYLFQGKKLPYHLGDDAEEGEVSDEDSADEIEDECKFKLHYVSCWLNTPLPFTNYR